MSAQAPAGDGDIRGLQFALVKYVIVLVAKLVAYYASGVMALFAEALHSLSDIFISGFLLLALWYSRRPADARHMFGYGRAQNVAAVLAALAALGGIAWGFPLADPIAALVVASIIAVNAVGMFVENARLLLGRAPDAEFMAALRRTALGVPGVVAINDVRAEFVGPQTVHAGIRIAVRPDLSVADAARIAGEVEQRVHAGMQSAHCFVQAEPAAGNAAT